MTDSPRTGRRKGGNMLAWLLIVLAFLGMADAWYLAASALTDTALSCDLGAVLDGCNIVAKSSYSHFMGIPLALYGVLFFACIFVLAAAKLVLASRHLDRALLVFGVLGSLASIGFLFLQFFVIQALCIYCIASAAITFMIGVVAYDIWVKGKPRILYQLSPNE